MTFAATVLALALIGGEPAHSRATTVDSSVPQSCITPERTGTYRLLAMSAQGHEPSTAVLMLENIAGCLEVTFVPGNAGPAVINRVSLHGNTLTGSMLLPTGTAAVSLQFTDKDIAGTIVQGKREWKVEGQRTS